MPMQLQRNLNLLKDKSPSSINITTLVTRDIDVGTGKKEKQKSTARRKGGRSSKQNPVSTTVDRPNLVPLTRQATSQVAMNLPQSPQPRLTLPAPTPPPVFLSTTAGSVVPAGDQFFLGLLQSPPTYS